MCYVRPLLASFSLQYCPSPTYDPVPSQSRLSPVLERHISAKEVKIQKKESTKTFMLYKKHQNQSNAGQSSLMWDKAASCGTKQSQVGQSSFIWKRAVSYITDQSNVEQSSLVWDRAVLCGTEWSHVEGSSIV